MLNKQLNLDLFEPNITRPENEIHTREKSDVRTGEAGETLALAKLKKWNINAFAVASGDAFDICADTKFGLKKIQVKTSNVLKATYNFTFMRGYYYSKKGVFPYQNHSFDIACCVNLIDEKILFSAGVQKNVIWKREQFNSDHAEILSWESAINALGGN